LLERLPTVSVRMVAFNLDQQKEIYRNNDFTSDSIQQVWHALNRLELNLVDYHTLLNRHGSIDLLADLVSREIHSEQPADAVLVLGPVARSIDRPERGALEKPTGNAPRFFFFQYKPMMRQTAALPDTLTLTVNSLKGKVMTIRTPAEFAKAIDQLEKQAAATKQ
jgi:hypothetical protein